MGIQSIEEAKESLEALRTARARWMTFNPVSSPYPVDLSNEHERNLIKFIRDQEEDPPLGVNVIMMLNDTIVKYEERLSEVDDYFDEQIKLIQEATETNASISAELTAAVKTAKSDRFLRVVCSLCLVTLLAILYVLIRK